MWEPISIWWFAGLLLLCYGIVIFITGLYEVARPLVHPPVLSNLHAPIWWGALLVIAGVGYIIRFHPRRSSGN